MSTRAAADRMMLVFGTLVAVVVSWRLAVAAIDLLPDSATRVEPTIIALPGRPGAEDASAPKVTETFLRQRIAREPTDAHRYNTLAALLAQEGKVAEAAAAYEQALRLDPGHPRILQDVGRFYLSTNEAERGLALLRQSLDTYPEYGPNVWPWFAAMLEVGSGRSFIERVARENPPWWSDFARFMCATPKERRAVPLPLVLPVVTARYEAGVLTSDERGCVIARMKNDGQWAEAYRFWRATLPKEQGDEGGLLFNGRFQWDPSGIGFDWVTPEQEGVKVQTVPIVRGERDRALRVTFVSKRYSGSPVYQYLMLPPGSYRLRGRWRDEGFESWLGLQWGVYCVSPDGSDVRQLARTDPLAGSEAWAIFRREFTVPASCPLQMLRLELSNPNREASTPGNVAVRLTGVLSFADVQISRAD